MQWIRRALGCALTCMWIFAGTATGFTHTSAQEPTPIPTGSTNVIAWPEPLIRAFDGVAMVYVPAGCFIMGSTRFDNESPPHEVCISGFWIDQYEVSNAQFERFGGQAEHASVWMDAARPRERITWDEARDFCSQRGGQLPTEAEWEYTARGPQSLQYPWGDDFDGGQVVSWKRIFEQGTAPVGSFPGGASWVGALDMSGNVFEWAADWWQADYYRTLDNGVWNPAGPTTGVYRVIRGGSWSLTCNFTLRTSYRFLMNPRHETLDRGFRCARDGTQDTH